MKHIPFQVLFFAFSFGVVTGCGESSDHTKQDVLDQFDENSQRPGIEDEIQEDSAVITGTPVRTD